MSARAGAAITAASSHESLRKLLLEWFERHKRDLPWRRTRDPYAIWVSEIMLQQTRVAAVVPYYQRFLARFPDFAALAEASDEDLLAYWAGLGYYHRARNLRKAAQRLVERGDFPATREEIRALPGIGEYTSAAIASIAFGHPHAAVDGNVVRVLSRVFADRTDTGSSAAPAHFARLAADVLDTTRPGAFNQAMMELGATICLPKNPQCLLCPVATMCRARQTGRVNELPVKLRLEKTVREERVFYWVEQAGRVLLWQRPAHARLMPGFWELPEPEHLPGARVGERIGTFRHAITFHNYRCEVYRAEAPAETGECRWASLDDLRQLPASTLLRKAQRLVSRRTSTAIDAGAIGAGRKSRID